MASSLIVLNAEVAFVFFAPDGASSQLIKSFLISRDVTSDDESH
jgi:hypothetical protein